MGHCMPGNSFHITLVTCLLTSDHSTTRGDSQSTGHDMAM